MSRELLGEFEQSVLLAVLHLGADAYGVAIVDEIARRSRRATPRAAVYVAIVDEIARRSRRATPRAAVYVAMRRLEVKGFLRARTERVRESIRRPRRYASVTPAGLAALRASRRAMNRMWAGLESLILES